MNMINSIRLTPQTRKNYTTTNKCKLQLVKMHNSKQKWQAWIRSNVLRRFSKWEPWLWPMGS